MAASSSDQRPPFGWRMLLSVAGALLLPLSIYALITISISYRDDRRATEAATLARAREVGNAVDARLQVIGQTIRVLATIRSIREQNWTEAQARSREISLLDPDWRNVSLIDLDRGVSLFDLRAFSPHSVKIDVVAARATAQRSMLRPTYAGIVRDAAGRPEIEAYYAVGPVGRPAYLFRVSLDPLFVQRILMASASTNGVSAVVDRRGLFIARSKAWPERLGTPATIHVRRAIARGASGFYPGITWEKLTTYTAFTQAGGDGWTVHVGVPSASIDRPQYGWRLSSILAAAASLALAALLVFLIMRLIAVRRASDLRVQQADRLETVGRLTGGIAHDFNNMLAIVIGSLDLAKRRLSTGSADVGRNIDNAMDGARRAADLTRRLLTFSRRQPLAPSAVDVNALIEAMRGLLDQTLSGDIHVETILGEGLWTTFVDPGQLENAIVNLAINARDAMPDGGRLTIATANRPRDDAGPDRIVITVTDTGSGMAPDVARRAFEPFFTTKEVGRGTGLGLSQLHGFVTQSGGSASIRSRVGEGTVVTLLLPRHEAALDEAALPVANEPDDAPRGRPDEIVLIVEDEEQLRRTNVEALRSLGYTVRHAADAGEAITLLRTQAVSLLVSDIVMPGMNGRDLALHVAYNYPDTRILLVTGFERDGEDRDEHPILRKPFGVAELARRARAELDRG